MDLVCTPSLEDKLAGSMLVVDTCVIVDASKNGEVNSLLARLRDKDCTLITLPSVLNEFTCSAFNEKEYQEMYGFFKSLDIVPVHGVEKKLLDNHAFDIAVRRSKVSHPSYVDRSLLFVPYLYKESAEEIYLATSNYKDVPHEFYELIGFASYEQNGFHNIGIYEFNLDKFNRIIR